MEDEAIDLPPDKSIRTYVLRAGRMTDAQRKALEELSPRYCIPVEAGKILDPLTVFGNSHPLVVEIGFGMGSATWRIARANPDINYLGFEVHTPGVGRLLSEIAGHGIENLRIVHHDAVECFESFIAPASLSGLHIFYPDPWPKKRHHKRRLLRPGLIDLLISRLAPGGYLYFVTDVEDYAVWSLELLGRMEGLRNRFDGFAPHQDWRPETKFEARANRDGGQAFELLFEKPGLERPGGQ